MSRGFIEQDLKNLQELVELANSKDVDTLDLAKTKISENITLHEKKMEDGKLALLVFYKKCFIALYTTVHQDGDDFVTASARGKNNHLLTWIFYSEKQRLEKKILPDNKKKELHGSCEVIFSDEIKQLHSLDAIFKPLSEISVAYYKSLNMLTASSAFHAIINERLSYYRCAVEKYAAEQKKQQLKNKRQWN